MITNNKIVSLPRALDVEMAVLGAMLIEKDIILKVMEMLDSEDFYKEIHKKIFSTICDLYNLTNNPVDLFNLADSLKKKGLLDEIGGVCYLTTLIESVQTIANVESYIVIIRDKSILRQIIHAGYLMVNYAFSETKSTNEILDKSQATLFKIFSKYKKNKGCISTSKLIIPILRKLEALHSGAKQISGLATGFKDLDIKTTGLHPAELIVLAARPSMGKTALALNIAEHVAIIENKPVGIFSLEMTQEMLIFRLLASLARVNAWKLRNGQYNNEDWKKLNIAARKIATSPIFIDDDANINITEIKIRARKLASELQNKGTPLSLIIVDYIQFIQGNRTENRQQEVSDISRSLKALAKDLDIPIIVISQLSRRTEDKGRKDNRPQLSDLRDSGAIEQDADLVIMLYRDWYYNRNNTELKKKATLIIGKQRNGPIGDINLIFEGEYTKFYDAYNVNDL
ncbi:MAG: replicative DNA helicase [Endomicrobium sp.]|jgi:replicative DNA helicase|nr:replicative DNA helicase [Endomicrobium sp.]